PANHLAAFLQRMLTVARIDSLRAVAQLEIDAAAQARCLFKLWAADFFRGTGVYGRFEHHNAARTQHGTYRPASADQQGKIGIVLVVHGRRNGHHEEVAALQVRQLVGELQGRRKQYGAFDLAGPVISLFEPSDSPLVHIKPDDIKTPGKRACHGQSDISKTTHCDSLYHWNSHCLRHIADTKKNFGPVPCQTSRVASQGIVNGRYSKTHF